MVTSMSIQPPDTDSLADHISKLEASVIQLVDLCEKLASENSALKRSNLEIQQDRADLLDKNDKTRTRVEAMIGRLKGMETASSRGFNER